jgi:hypothetical protein
VLNIWKKKFEYVNFDYRDKQARGVPTQPGFSILERKEYRENFGIGLANSSKLRANYLH